jgi:hypothetical protein
VNRRFLLLGGLAFYVGAGVADTVDVYGLSAKDANKLLKQYSKVVGELETQVLKEIKTQAPDKDLNASLKAAVEKKYNLLNEITQKNGYLFVDFQTTLYPNDTYSTTIEIIDKQHPERLKFVNAMPMRSPKEDIPEKKSGYKPDLIDAMTKYHVTSMHMLMAHQVSPKAKCPVYHCTVAFDHPKLKPYLALFNNGAIKDKKLIIETLRHDKSSERRASAAFLVGHFKDPHDILSILSPSVTDKDDGVRNNVMRVIGAVMDKEKIRKIEVTPFLNALDSPYVTDRNKALWILKSAVDHPASKKIILQQGGDKLLALLELKQPNNHDLAYIILKKISGKDFGSNNVLAWRAWVEAARRGLG